VRCTIPNSCGQPARCGQRRADGKASDRHRQGRKGVGEEGRKGKKEKCALCERETVTVDGDGGCRSRQGSVWSVSQRVPAEIVGDRVTTRFLLKRREDRAVQDERSWRASFKNYFRFDHRLH